MAKLLGGHVGAAGRVQQLVEPVEDHQRPASQQQQVHQARRCGALVEGVQPVLNVRGHRSFGWVLSGELAERDQERNPAHGIGRVVVQQHVRGRGLARPGIAQQHGAVDLLGQLPQAKFAGSALHVHVDGLNDPRRNVKVGDGYAAAPFEVGWFQLPVLFSEVTPVSGQKIGLRTRAGPGCERRGMPLDRLQRGKHPG